jgi:hypothetical protein
MDSTAKTLVDAEEQGTISDWLVGWVTVSRKTTSEQGWPLSLASSRDGRNLEVAYKTRKVQL